MPNFRQIAICFAVALPAMFMSGAAWSWGVEGHRGVADLAGTRLTRAPSAEVARLLALEPGATLASISTWPDEVRAPTAANWHYINFEESDCNFDAARHCPGGQCVVGAIERQARVLKSHAADTERLKALKYIVHFVADIHQPLHAGYAHDRGANQFQVRWHGHGHGTNLHALLDSGLIHSHSDGEDNLAPLVRARPSQSPSPSSPARWAVESCRIVQSAWFYRTSTKPGSLYKEAHSEALLSQIDLAAWRLAILLKDILGSTSP